MNKKQAKKRKKQNRAQSIKTASKTPLKTGKQWTGEIIEYVYQEFEAGLGNNLVAGSNDPDDLFLETQIKTALLVKDVLAKSVNIEVDMVRTNDSNNPQQAVQEILSKNPVLPAVYDFQSFPNIEINDGTSMHQIDLISITCWKDPAGFWFAPLATINTGGDFDEQPLFLPPILASKTGSMAVHAPYSTVNLALEKPAENNAFTLNFATFSDYSMVALFAMLTSSYSL